jgi:hypothetical protein
MEDAMSDLKKTNKRLEAAAWGVGLLVVGGLGLVPGEQASLGVLSIGVILLALNLARVGLRIPVNWFTSVLGALAFGLGLAGMFVPMHLDFFSLLLVVIGLAFLIPGQRPLKAVG